VNTVFTYYILAICFFASSCGYGSVRVPTGAMQPTISVGSYVIWDKSAYASANDVKRFDLVLHTLPPSEKNRARGIDENTRFIFRVIGLGGEKVELRNGDVFIDGKKLNQPFEKNPSTDSFATILVPVNEYFLLGDNRPESEDSRFWQPSTIGLERIAGKVMEIL